MMMLAMENRANVETGDVKFQGLVKIFHYPSQKPNHHCGNWKRCVSLGRSRTHNLS
jgi:hypothetical protein